MTQRKHISTQKAEKQLPNVLLQESTLPFGALDFGQVTLEGIREAVLKGIEEEDREIQEIVDQKAKPTFRNTMLRLEHTGKTLERAWTALEQLLGNQTSDALENLAQELTPAFSEHVNNIHFNKPLFQRIEALKNAHPRLNAEEQRLLDKTYDAFLRRGIHLSKKKQDRLRHISMESGQAALTFSRNVLDDKNRFLLVVHDRQELDGLTPHQLESAAQTARERGIVQGWAFTLDGPSFSPLLTHCRNRRLRKKVWLAYNRLGCKGDKYDNQELVKTLVNLRQESARLLGYDCYADLVLTQRMAGSKERVSQFLQQLIDRYKPQARREQAETEAFAQQMEGKDFHMKPWDGGYYSRLLQMKKYKVDAEKLRPYFELKRVIQGVFGLAEKLYGIHFKENTALPAWHKDVKIYEVYDSDHSFLALLYADFHPRKEKKGGAWTSPIRGQYKLPDGTNVRPHVAITMNFSKPTGRKPALLSLGEVSTFLHEFGHALHEIFSQATFASQAGTNVYWDFVELPSQLMENFALEKDFLKTFAVHYKTGKPLPETLIDKIIASRTFHAALACMRQVSFGLLDMAYYTQEAPFDTDVFAFEKKAWRKARLKSQKLKVCMSTQFRHIMTGGYAAGYYSYKWAEVLDADAFAVFQEHGIFDKATATRFRKCILEKGSTQDPNVLYQEFRGKEPTLDALLRRDGIIK